MALVARGLGVGGRCRPTSRRAPAPAAARAEQAPGAGGGGASCAGGRRDALRSALGAAGAALLAPGQASAVGFKKELKKRAVSADDFVASEPFEWRGEPHDPIKYFDKAAGSGDAVKSGQLVTVHYDVRYRGLTVQSSREAQLLGGNRSIAEPFTFEYGTVPDDVAKGPRKKAVVGIGAELKVDPVSGLYVSGLTRKAPADRAGIEVNDAVVAIDGTPTSSMESADVAAALKGVEGSGIEVTIRKPDTSEETVYKLERETYYLAIKKRAQPQEGGGGLYTGGSVKPPAAIFLPQSLAGMRRGGRRTVKVPPELGYEGEGKLELPPDTPFELEVELLEVKDAAA